MAANISGFTEMDLAQTIHKFDMLVIQIKVTKWGNHLQNTSFLHNWQCTNLYITHDWHISQLLAVFNKIILIF